MAIHTIDDVKVNGRNQAFGGFIYAVDYGAGLLDKPSEITVNFVSQNGQYLEPELSVTKPYRITIGNIINDNFFAVSRTFVKGSNGRTLEVVFKDGSILLDRIWVGLNKKMGDATTNVPGLIIVGREIHPCDVNEDGVFDQADVAELVWQGQDPCELRCPNESSLVEPVINNCIEREILEVFDVKYSFKDLLDALARQVDVSKFFQARTVTYPVEADKEVGTESVSVILPGVEINKNLPPFNSIKINYRPKNLNEFYLAAYTGTLREVLRNWCADFGWSFFWENGGLSFIDTKERPQIQSFDSTSIESLTDTKTLEGTVSRGFISHYAHQGVTAQKDCSQTRPLLLRCLTLRDLFGDFYKPAWNAVVHTQNDYSSTGEGLLSPPIPDPKNNSPDNQLEYRDTIAPAGVPIEAFETSCVCAYHSDKLRHLYNLWGYYGIINAQAARDNKFKWLDRLGQIQIVSVFAKDSTGDNLTTYERLLADGAIDKNSKTFFSKEEVDRIKTFNGYIVVVLRNRLNKKESLLNKQFQLEEALASNFIGQHWYRGFISPFYGESPQIFPNGQYFGALSTNISDLPFSNFHHTYNSNISKMISSFAQRQRNDFRQYGGLKFSTVVAENTAKKLVRSIIYFQRNTAESWVPQKNTNTLLSSFINELDNYMFKQRELEDFSDTDLRSLVTENGTQLVDDKLLPYLEMYVMYPAPNNRFNVGSSIVKHPIKEPVQHTESLEPFALATAGLLSDDCAKYTINGLQLFTPIGGSVLFEHPSFRWSAREPVASDYSSPTYKVFVTNTTSNRGIVAKTESTLILEASPDKALTVDYQVRDISRDAVQFMNNLSNSCELPAADIAAIHRRTSTNLNFSVTEPFVSKQYRILGVTLPSAVGIKDGLESFKIRFGADGVFTELSIGNSLFTPPSPNVIYRALELGIEPKLVNLKTNSLK